MKVHSIVFHFPNDALHTFVTLFVEWSFPHPAIAAACCVPLRDELIHKILYTFSKISVGLYL